MIANDNYIQHKSVQVPGIHYGFFTRKGGVSQGLYGSLNVGLTSGDTSESVAENRRRVAGTFGQSIDRLYTLSQTHSDEVQLVTPSQSVDVRPDADAMVTKHPNCVLGILTADCVPVFFIDPESKIIGAAHAGWRGALGGIVSGTLTRMQQLGADRSKIQAIIGPSIRQPSYEVDAEFKVHFIKQNPENESLFIDSEKADHFMFDLPGYVNQIIAAEGVANISDVNYDTYTNEELFFSYRRKTHKGEEAFGRQISAIMIKES